jgi:hypothetical protein
VGTLSLPPFGEIYLDTAPIIYSVEKHADYWSLLRPAWEMAESGQILLVSSELAWLEALTGPLKRGDAQLAATYEQLFTSTDMLIEITPDIL